MLLGRVGNREDVVLERLPSSRSDLMAGESLTVGPSISVVSSSIEDGVLSAGTTKDCINACCRRGIPSVELERDDKAGDARPKNPFCER